MKYFKIIVVVLSFSLTLYIQHVNNTAQIAELETVWKWKSRTSMTVSTP